MNNAEADELLLVGDVVRLFAELHEEHIVKATVRLWVDTNKLRASRSLGGVRLIRRADLDRFMEERMAARRFVERNRRE